MIQGERVQVVNSRPVCDGRYVLYWMQASQSAECNHALEYAILKSNELRQPLIVYFGITDDYPEANERHYKFMLEGLKETRSALRGRGIQTVVRHESPETTKLYYVETRAAEVADATWQEPSDLCAHLCAQVPGDIVSRETQRQIAKELM